MFKPASAGSAKRIGIALAIALAVRTGAPASADDSAPATAALISAAQRAPLELTIGGVDRGIVLAYIVDKDIWVPADALHKAEVKFPDAAVHTVSGVAYVSLHALAPGVTYKYDAAALSVDVRIANPAALAASGTNVDLSPTRLQTQPASAVPSGFLSYNITESVASQSTGELGGFFDAGFSDNAGRFDATNNVDSSGFHRGLYAFTFDNDTDMHTVVVGDNLTEMANPLSSDVVLGGITVERNFSLQPDFIRYPTPAFSGTALSPTTADIYINGALYRTVQLQPGPFSLQDLNLPVGSNVTQVVLHDAFGNVSQFGSAFYFGQQVLAKGVTSYDYQLGFQRPNPFGIGDYYGPLAAVGAYRLGVTNAITAGGAFEASSGIVEGGPTLSARLPIGQLDVAAAASDSRGVDGRAGSAAYSYISARIAAQAAVQLQSNNFSTIVLPVTSDRTTTATFESFDYRFSQFVDVDLSHVNTHNRDISPSDQIAAAINARSGGVGTWTLSVQRNHGSIFGLNTNGTEENSWTTALGYALPMGKSGYLQASSSNGDGTNVTSVTYTNSAPNSPGQTNYTATAQVGPGQSAFFANGQYRANNFDVLGQFTEAAGGTSGLVGLSGALAFFKQGVFFTSPLQNAYGLVYVDGPPGLPVSLYGTEQGTTDGRGYVVVPDMVPYIDNRVEVGGLETLPEYQIDSTEKIVVPRNQSASDVNFAVVKVQLFVGTLLVRSGGQSVAPKYGLLELVGPSGKSVSDIGENGEFFFESLKSGKYRATITYNTLPPCAFDLVVPKSKDFKVDLGEQTCTER